MTYKTAHNLFLPTTRHDMAERGWDQIDILLVTGDAYVDHPSFGVPLLARWLERLGFKVGVLAQPKWDSISDFAMMGRPRLFMGISSGTVDSMINNYTANKRPRSDDMYSENGLALRANETGGKNRIRPDYASVVYSRLARKAFPDTPIIAGGVEVSLRRLAHYDYWQNRVRPSVLLELQAELLVFGMGETPTTAIATAFRSVSETTGVPVSMGHPRTKEVLEELKALPGVAYVTSKERARALEPRLTLPSFEEIRDDKRKFARSAYLIEYEASPYNGARLVQYHGSRAVVVNPPSLPLSARELDSIYELPFTKLPHPSYKGRIPAAEMIQASITSMRGCFGGCSFCAITLHQGRIVRSRSRESILKEITNLKNIPGFKGIITDIGGPTANMFGLSCKSDEVQSKCRKLSCVFPETCPHLLTSHRSQIELLRKARQIPGIRKITISSGLRFDLALSDQRAGQEYLDELITHHVGGHLKVAPEHSENEVLALMKKPTIECFEVFLRKFREISAKAGKEQYVVPYFMSGFPGTSHENMKNLNSYLKRKGWRVQQVQAFIPTPMTLATAMYWTGLDPMSKKNLFVPRSFKDRKLQQALLQPERPGHKKIIKSFSASKAAVAKTIITKTGLR